MQDLKHLKLLMGDNCVIRKSHMHIPTPARFIYHTKYTKRPAMQLKQLPNVLFK